MDRLDGTIERDLADALRRLTADAAVPPIDPAREAALLAAFDAAHRPVVRAASGRQYWYMAALATAAAVLIAAGVTPYAGSIDTGRVTRTNVPLSMAGSAAAPGTGRKSLGGCNWTSRLLARPGMCVTGPGGRGP